MDDVQYTPGTDNARDEYAELRQQLSGDVEYAPAWRPEVGGELVGVITQVDYRVNEWHKPPGYKIVTVLTPDLERVAVHAIHTTLAEDLAPARVGDKVGILYKGKTESATGVPYHAYTTRVVPASEDAQP